jgi:hypothetical protein
VADDARHDGHAPSRRLHREKQGGPPSPREGGPSACGAAETSTRMAGPLRGTHHLADEGLRAPGTAVAVADASGPNAEIVTAGNHAFGSSERGVPALGALKLLAFQAGEPARVERCQPSKPSAATAHDRNSQHGLYLVVRGSRRPAPDVSPPTPRYRAPARDRSDDWSWRRILMRNVDKQPGRLRHEARQIRRSSRGRRAPVTHSRRHFMCC